MGGGAGGEQKGGPEVLAVGDGDLQAIGWWLRRLAGPGDLRDEVANEFAAAAEIAGDRHALEFGPCLPDRVLGVREPRGRSVQMKAALSGLALSHLAPAHAGIIASMDAGRKAAGRAQPISEARRAPVFHFGKHYPPASSFQLWSRLMDEGNSP